MWLSVRYPPLLSQSEDPIPQTDILCRPRRSWSRIRKAKKRRSEGNRAGFPHPLCGLSGTPAVEGRICLQRRGRHLHRALQVSAQLLGHVATYHYLAHRRSASALRYGQVGNPKDVHQGHLACRHRRGARCAALATYVSMEPYRLLSLYCRPAVVVDHGELMFERVYSAHHVLRITARALRISIHCLCMESH